MRTCALAVVLSVSLLPGVARGQASAEVKRGALDVKVRVSGTVVPMEVFRIKSAVEGRVEEVRASTYTWADSGKDLGFLANKELVALMDARSTTQQGVMEDRWERVYKPTAIRCPDTCFLLRSFLRPRLWVKPQAVLFEAARGLRMVGRVRPEDAHWVKDGQLLDFWAVKDPSRKYQARVAHYVLDVQGSKVDPGATFTMDMSPSRWFEPGTAWEGLIVPRSKKNVLTVPTGALISYKGNIYLPVKVSTGITTASLTEVTAGIDENRRILVLDDAHLKEAQRHTQTVDQGAMDDRLHQENTAPALREAKPAPRRLPEIRDPDSNLGEDPYGE